MGLTKARTSLCSSLSDAQAGGALKLAGRSVCNRAILSLIELNLRSDILRPLAFAGINKYIASQVGAGRSCYVPQVQQDKLDLARAILCSFQRTLDRGHMSGNVLHTMLRCTLANYVMPDEGARSAASEFARKHGGSSPPVFMVISPSKACNLRCTGCYASAESSSPGMDWQVFDRIVAEAKTFWGIRFFVFSGGEPFAYRSQGKSILDMAEKHPDCFFLCYTNGTLIDEHLGRLIAAAGNLTPAISVEGFEELTDRRRGKGVFQRVLNAMAQLGKSGVPFGLSLTAGRENAEELLSDAFIEFFFGEQGATYGWIFQYMPIGKAYTLDLLVTPEQRLWMWRRMWELIRKRKILLADFWNCGTVSEGCMAADYCYIDWNGKVMPCVFVPYAAANIHDIYEQGHTLDDVYGLPYFQAIRGWRRNYDGCQEHPGKCGNWLIPCSLRDHYDTGRALINIFRPEPEDAASAEALQDTEYQDGMLRYGQRLQEVFGPVWREEYLAGAESGSGRAQRRG